LYEAASAVLAQMLQSALLNVLVEVFGEYVEGLSKENLSLSVWEGRYADVPSMHSL
jgi:DNA-binding winged helix-turn-helix (wHTH) protein